MDFVPIDQARLFPHGVQDDVDINGNEKSNKDLWQSPLEISVMVLRREFFYLRHSF